MEQQEIDRIVANCNKIAQSFRIELDKEPKQIINFKTLYPLTSFQFLDLLKKLKDEVQNLSIQEIITIYNKIQLNFSHVYIKDDIYYSGVLPNIDFSGSVFDGKVTFENVVFIGKTNFSGSLFNGTIQFSNINENHETKNIIYFNSAEINSAEFNNVKCSEIHFRSSKITGCKFNTLVCNNAYFEHTHIRKDGGVFFIDVDIIMHAKFNSLILDGGIVFRKIRCSHEFDLSNNNFRYFEIDDSHIKGQVSFINSTFQEKVDFNKKLVFNKVDFSHVEFKKKTNFSNMEFKAAPLFHEATLHQDTSFEGACFLSCKTEEDYRAYRTLKQHMSDVHAKLEENIFFALEQKTRQYLDIQDFKKGKIELFPAIVISKFYDSISEYGQSLFKPIWQLFALWAIFPGIFVLPNMVAASQKLNEPVNSWFNWMPAGYGYSTQNVFNPLGAINIFNTDKVYYPLNIGIAAMGWLEAILSLAIITLWLLAVRRRFQKGE